MNARRRPVRLYPSFLPIVTLALTAFSAACSTDSPVAPSTTSSAAEVSGADRRVGGVGGGDGQCGEDPEDPVPCDEPGAFDLETASGNTLSGFLENGQWFISGGTGHLEGSAGSAEFGRSINSLQVSLNFSTAMSRQRPVLATGTLQLIDSQTSRSAACLSGSQITERFGGTMESLGLVTLKLEYCAA